MDSEKLEPLERIKECLDKNHNFVLQGGAGSGKTETLKRTLRFLSESYPNKKVACITHTNLAVAEIISRVGDDYTVSTIHSFLNTCIKDYKNSLHKVIFELFRLDNIERLGLEHYDNGKEQNKTEHAKYKKIYDKCAASLYTVKKDRLVKVEGKKEYDKDPEKYNAILNEHIRNLNSTMSEEIESSGCDGIEYNNTSFDSYKDLTFGHDGLLKISSLMFFKYPMLGRILQDKYDCIFIDEYQDTNKEIIDVFLKCLPSKNKTLVGLFGDSMQAIYSDGVGSVEQYVKGGFLTKIYKKDNYRCSEQVVSFINKFRDDGLEQKVAFKKRSDASYETLDSRQGVVEFYYEQYEGKKPHARSSQDDKSKYVDCLDNVISKALEGEESFKQLKLTNKSIASYSSFETLYEVFNKRYADSKEAMEKILTKLQLSDLYELCNAYAPHENSGVSPDYNLVISKLKQQGIGIKKVSDKQRIKNNFDAIMKSNSGIIETLEAAFEFNLLKKSEAYLSYQDKKDQYLSELSADKNYQKLKILFLSGENTHAKMIKEHPGMDKYDFDELKRKLKAEEFYNDLFSNKVKFQEVISYFNYQNEYTPFITMHKTKGSGIDKVLVVLDEYFWNEYDFSSIFLSNNGLDEKQKNRKLNSQKLFYVACSRAKTNLKIVRVVSTQEEKEQMKSMLDDIEGISLINTKEEE